MASCAAGTPAIVVLNMWDKLHIKAEDFRNIHTQYFKLPTP